ncbi:hypothetical protein Tsubulata_014095 [Turnera subulata]|uniref:non-specific serine/threonine protein kinase n=1 Tax=Turnera subulata TaxID=218843 RepID=A0A9Q0JMX8_9ROSI|nr:hypothetical protein Tsubulata_014095 [Turnera subulata]
MTCNSLILLLLLLLLSYKFHPSNSQESWIRAGYWDSSSELPISSINSALFTHLICAFAHINSSTYQLYVSDTKKQSFSSFTSTVRAKNPSVVSLLSVRGGDKDLSVVPSMVGQSSYRKSFIESSIKTARTYGFDGLELYGVEPSRPSTNMTNLGNLLHEWRDAVDSEPRVAGKPRLLLVMASYYLSPEDHVTTYPVDSIRRNLDWVHIVAYDYYVPTETNITGAHAALYGDPKWRNTDKCIKEWLRRGLPASKMVLGVPYHGYAWVLANPDVNVIGAPASGPAITKDGSMGYKIIKSFIKNYGYGVSEVYNSTAVVNFFTVGPTWINFDDVDTIKAKISYALENRLAGYSVFHLSNDENWVLSEAGILLFLGLMMCWYFRRKALKAKATRGTFQRSLSTLRIKVSATEYIDTNAPNVQLFSLDTIRTATNDFSSDNKLGEGGFGAVYKGKLPRGKEIAVKRLSRTSHQGAEEFKNEVSLTARLQHVNLLRVLGFCTEKEEKMLIYEFMPNKSLDFYLYDRDIKASNILLDEQMNAKISDFGMARLFRKDEIEANTGRIVGTYGYVPPEYVRKGIYSIKYDVYSFGVLLLQIISGKRNTRLYGAYENLNLLEYAYESWKNGEGVEFIDPTLDDSSSTWKLKRCMQVALLCVQENPLDRPSMLEVSLMLKNETAEIANPKRPAFSVKAGEEGEECGLRETTMSVDDATISQVLPR